MPASTSTFPTITKHAYPVFTHDYYGNRVGARFSFADQYMGLVGQPSRE